MYNLEKYFTIYIMYLFSCKKIYIMYDLSLSIATWL